MTRRDDLRDVYTRAHLLDDMDLQHRIRHWILHLPPTELRDLLDLLHAWQLAKLPPEPGTAAHMVATVELDELRTGLVDTLAELPEELLRPVGQAIAASVVGAA